MDILREGEDCSTFRELRIGFTKLVGYFLKPDLVIIILIIRTAEGVSRSIS